MKVAGTLFCPAPMQARITDIAFEIAEQRNQYLMILELAGSLKIEAKISFFDRAHRAHGDLQKDDLVSIIPDRTKEIYHFIFWQNNALRAFEVDYRDISFSFSQYSILSTIAKIERPEIYPGLRGYEYHLTNGFVFRLPPAAQENIEVGNTVLLFISDDKIRIEYYHGLNRERGFFINQDMMGSDPKK